MRTLAILIYCIFVSGCTTYPDRLHLGHIQSKIVDNEDNSYFQRHLPDKEPQSTRKPTLVLSVEGKAPFAHIKGEGRQAQFRCYVISIDGHALSDVEFGRVFFAGMISPPNTKTDFYTVYGDERYRYKIFLYSGMKARREVNQPPNFDLLQDAYKHIKCHLVGVQMFSGFMYSNDIFITKEEMLSINKKYLEKTSNTQKKTMP